MTTQPRHAPLTADAFIEWAAAQPTGRYELAAGEILLGKFLIRLGEFARA